MVLADALLIAHHSSVFTELEPLYPIESTKADDVIDDPVTDVASGAAPEVAR